MGGENNWERDYDLNAARRSPALRQEAAHQSEALTKLQRWYEAAPAGHAGGLLVLPTGGGKTFTAVRFLCRHPLSDGYKVLWLAHTHHLLEQALDAFGKRDDPPGGMEVASIHEPKERLKARVVSSTPGHSRIADVSPEDDVVICTLQTAVRAYRDKHSALRAFLDAADGKLMVVFDEAHHAPAPSYTAFLVGLREELRQMKLLGLTATPMYNDERREGWLARLFPQGIVSQVGAAKLVAAGILATPRVRRCETSFSPDFNPGDFERWRATYQDLPDALITQLAENQSRNDAICRAYLERASEYGKTIIFADRWFQCDYLAEKLKQQGIRADVMYSYKDPGGATADERNARSRDENALVLQRFRDNELEVLVNIRMLTEGTDVPSVQSVFVTRQTTSRILLRQMVGRALRGPKFNGTASANIVMFTDRWREAIQWAEFGELSSAEAADDESTTRVQLPLQLVSIDLVRRLARQMESGTVESAPFIELLPIGWYVPEFDVEIAGTEDSVHQRQMILVYADEREVFEAFLRRLGEVDLTRFADPAVSYDTVASDLDEWAEEFFAQEEMRSSALGMNLFHLARHLAQSAGELPPFFPLEHRDAHDLAPIVERAAAGDWGPLKTRQELDPVYSDTRYFWRALFPTFDLFCNQFRLLVDGAIHLRHGGSSAPPQPVVIIAPSAPLPDREPSDGVKREVHRRDGHTCLCCGSVRRLHVDHIRSWYHGGLNDPDNLQTLCSVCNYDKAVREMNFRKSGTLLSAPPAFEFPSGFGSSHIDDLVSDVQRTVNMFYGCAAIDEIDYRTRGMRRREWQIRLRTGNPRGWFGAHLETLLERIQLAQPEESAGRLRSLVLTGATLTEGESDDPMRVWSPPRAHARPLKAADIRPRRAISVYWPECIDFPCEFVAAKVVSVDATARHAAVRTQVDRSTWDFSGVPFSAIYPPRSNEDRDG